MGGGDAGFRMLSVGWSGCELCVRCSDMGVRHLLTETDASGGPDASHGNLATLLPHLVHQVLMPVTSTQLQPQIVHRLARGFGKIEHRHNGMSNLVDRGFIGR